MTTVRDMIRKKGDEVFKVNPTASILDALELMDKYNIGSLLVMDDDSMVGILSERDCIRKVELQGKNVRETQVSDIMTDKVVSVDAAQPLEECMTLMLERNIRHLPVFDGQQLLGLLSVRDVLKEVVDVQQMMLSELERYITGGGQ